MSISKTVAVACWVCSGLHEGNAVSQMDAHEEKRLLCGQMQKTTIRQSTKLKKLVLVLIERNIQAITVGCV